jgi:hypothetical protein
MKLINLLDIQERSRFPELLGPKLAEKFEAARRNLMEKMAAAPLPEGFRYDISSEAVEDGENVVITFTATPTFSPYPPNMVFVD